jgi:hypothetical protein
MTRSDAVIDPPISFMVISSHSYVIL